MRDSRKPGRAGEGLAAAAVMAVCCGSHLLALGVLGALAAGTAFGVLAGVLVAAAIAGLLLVLRRRRPATCPTASAKTRSRSPVRNER